MSSVADSGRHAPATAPRRFMLVSARSSTLVAVQRACRRDSAVQLRFFAHAAAAMRAPQARAPDVLLLDVANADRAGRALVERLQGFASRPTIVLVGEAMNARMSDAIVQLDADGGVAASAPDLLERVAGIAYRAGRERAHAA